jgi:hypothetical protein
LIGNQTPSQIPNYIKAGSLQGLRRLMLLNNTRKSAWHKYFDIKYVNEGLKTYWIAWYYENIDDKSIDEQSEELSDASE